MGFELIADGYTQTADCRGLTVTYRPIPIDVWVQTEEALQAYKGDDRRKETAKMIASRIDKWDATVEGAAVEPTAENVLKLPVAAWLRIQDLLLGYTSDGVNTQGDDAKNSEAA